MKNPSMPVVAKRKIVSKVARLSVVSLMAVCIFSAPTGSPALAQDVENSSAEKIKKAAEDVLIEVPLIDAEVENTKSERSEVVVDETDAETVVSLETAPGAELAIPIDPDEPIELSNPSVKDLEVELPGDPEKAEVASDGTVAYEDAATDTDLLVQPQKDGGVRVITVIDGPDAPSEFDFKVDAAGRNEIRIMPDGSAFVVNDEEEIVSYTPAPWAFDANGTEVPTWYTVSPKGDSLILNVDHSSVDAYPVVADPCWSCWGRRAFFGAAGATGAASQCSPGGPWAMGACGALGFGVGVATNW